MTVKELIRELQKLDNADQEMDVLIDSDDRGFYDLEIHNVFVEAKSKVIIEVR